MLVYLHLHMCRLPDQIVGTVFAPIGSLLVLVGAVVGAVVGWGGVHCCFFGTFYSISCW